MRILSVFIFTLAFISQGLAAQSSYTKYDFDKDCDFEQLKDQEDEGMGASAICKVAGKPDMYFMEGDLRHSVGFGALQRFESFGVWNNTGTTVEWRSDNNGIYGAIFRFYVSNYNNKTGEFDTGNQGQILMIYKVAKTTRDQTCVVAMVDARANTDANVRARELADTMTNSFNCDVDIPTYWGVKGEHAAAFMANKPQNTPAK